MSPFANQMIVVTGAASGLGRALSHRLVAEGAAVAGIDRNADGLQSLAKELNGQRFAGSVADVTDAYALAQAVQTLETTLGPTDRLIANAGIGWGTPATEFSAADFAAIVNVNLLGVANSVAAVLPGMIERKRGHLIGISSLASFRGLPFMAAYCASKAGVSSLFDSLAVELKPLGIAVTTICPGWIRTPLTESVAVEMRNMLEIEDAVGRVLAAIRSRRRFVAFPRRLAFLARAARWLPTRLADRLVAGMVRPRR